MCARFPPQKSESVFWIKKIRSVASRQPLHGTGQSSSNETSFPRRESSGHRVAVFPGGRRAAGALIGAGCWGRPYLERNWQQPPIDPGEIDFLLLTHATSLLRLIPRLVNQGFKSPVLTTAASIELTNLVLKDAAHIQEEGTRSGRQVTRTKNHCQPAPAGRYTVADVERAMTLFENR